MGVSATATPCGWRLSRCFTDDALLRRRRGERPDDGHHARPSQGHQGRASRNRSNLALVAPRRRRFPATRNLRALRPRRPPEALEAVRPSHRFDLTFQDTVPTALICALESASLGDAVRKAVSLGGEADTLVAIAGSVDEALHGRAASVHPRPPGGLLRPVRGPRGCEFQSK